MKKTNLLQMTVEQLVDRFAAIAIEQYQAELVNDNAKFTRLFWQMEAVEGDLKARAGDQRRALFRLFNHSNIQVRLAAGKATLAVEPSAARQLLEAIANSHEFPQAGHAGMTVMNLDEGVFRPP